MRKNKRQANPALLRSLNLTRVADIDHSTGCGAKKGSSRQAERLRAGRENTGMCAGMLDFFHGARQAPLPRAGRAERAAQRPHPAGRSGQGAWAEAQLPPLPSRPSNVPGLMVRPHRFITNCAQRLAPRWTRRLERVSGPARLHNSSRGGRFFLTQLALEPVRESPLPDRVIRQATAPGDVWGRLLHLAYPLAPSVLRSTGRKTDRMAGHAFGVAQRRVPQQALYDQAVMLNICWAGGPMPPDVGDRRTRCDGVTACR
jgi:hypothetical protein